MTFVHLVRDSQENVVSLENNLVVNSVFNFVIKH